eukprot:scaffold20566_cov135-Isochrysis_galbana.AAC.1
MPRRAAVAHETRSGGVAQTPHRGAPSSKARLRLDVMEAGEVASPGQRRGGGGGGTARGKANVRLGGALAWTEKSLGRRSEVPRSAWAPFTRLMMNAPGGGHGDGVG